jgi:hypothetical protein
VNLKSISCFFGVDTTWFLIFELLELVKSFSDGSYLRKSLFNFGGKFEFRSYLSYYNCKLPKIVEKCQIVSQNGKQSPKTPEFVKKDGKWPLYS